MFERIKKVMGRVTGSAAPKAGTVPTGESSGPQSLILPSIIGGNLGNIAGIPGFAGGVSAMMAGVLSGTGADWLVSDPYAYGKHWLRQWYWGTYNTYRLVAAHPRCQQAYATLTNPIVAGTWDYEVVKEGCPDWLVKLVKDQITPLRRRYVEDAMSAVNLGWQGFEPIWEVRDGKNWLAKLKPFLQDITSIRTDEQGNIVELINGVTNYTGSADPAGRFLVENYKALVYTFRPQCGYWYGFPLTESVRLVAWRMWLNAAFDLHKLSDKLSSIIAMGFAPAGSYTDPVTKATITPKDEMATALSGLKDSGLAVFTNLVAMAKPGANAADLAKMSASAMSSIMFHDAGNHSGAISGYMEIMEKAEDLFFAAYLLSSRTGMQSKNGSRADSEQHSDTGLVSSELIASDLAEQLQPMVDAILVLNGGEQWRGAVRVKQSPLVDTTKALYGTLMTTALQDQTIGPELYATLDWEAMSKRADVPVKEGADINKQLQSAVDTKRKTDAANALAMQKGAAMGVKPGAAPQGDGETKLSMMLSAFVSGENEPAGTLELSAPPYKFASTQVNIPEPHRASLLKFVNSIPDDEIDPKDGRETDPHVTCKYGLHDESPDGVADVVKDEKAPNLRLGKMGVFPASEKRNSDVVYVSVHSPDIHRLNKKICAACEHTDTYPTYTPHLTLAYLKPGEGAKYDGGADFDGLGIKPTHLTHASKDGTATHIPFADTSYRGRSK